MCFSATASFTTAVLTGVVGIATLSKATQVREIPIAMIPLDFAAQQVAEGMLWLGFVHAWPAYAMLFIANFFVLIALAFWPMWSPLAVGLAERVPARRRAILALLPVGLVLAGYSAWNLVENPYAASVVHHSICYISRWPYPAAVVPVYMLCTVAPLFLSSDSFLRKLGGVLTIGAVVSFAIFYTSFVSVWCFFAAAASIGIYAFFHQRQLTAPTAARAAQP